MFEKITLKSGLRIILYPMANTEAVTFLVLINTGSRYEEKQRNGISHFLEHTFFKGTKKRPTTLAIAKELDKVGGVYNAFTGKEVMGFWVKIAAKHFSVAADVLSDMLFNPLFDPRELEKEKKVIFEEINMIEDNPQRYVADLWEKLLYGDQPIGWLIPGSKETVASVSRDDILSYFQKQFTAESAIVVLAGGFKKETVCCEAEKFFDKFPKGKIPEKKTTKEEQTKPEILLHFKETEQTHLCLGVRAFNLFSPKRYILEVLSGILGGSMSSRLPVEVRQKRSLSYYVTASLSQYTDSGYLVTQAGVDNRRIEEAIKIILQEYRKLKTIKVPAPELKKVKENIKGRMALALETSDAWASYLGEQEILEKQILTPEEECAKIDKVNQEEILQAAKEIFRPEKLNLALIGPFKEKEKFLKILTI